MPGLAGEHQLDNAATALMALALVDDRLPVSDQAVRQGLAAAGLRGRFQVISGRVEWILDVAHNQEASQGLAANLGRSPCAGKTRAVVAVLARKDATALLRPLLDVVDVWYPLQLPDADARPAEELTELLVRQVEPARVAKAGSADELFDRAEREAEPGDRIVVFGSFRTVEEALRRLTKAE